MVLEPIHAWLHQRRRPIPRPRPPAQLRRTLLQVEVLEDRLTPSAPTATLTSAPPVLDVTNFFEYQFTVTYADSDDNINAGTLDNTDIRITGPKNFSALADLVSVTPSGNASPITATYHITLPHGNHCHCFDGFYGVSVEPN